MCPQTFAATEKGVSWCLGGECVVWKLDLIGNMTLLCYRKLHGGMESVIFVGRDLN